MTRIRPPDHHLAQLNIARALDDLDSVRMADFVMWWIAAGQTPSIDDAMNRLAHLNAHGPTDFAFGWESVPSGANASP